MMLIGIDPHKSTHTATAVEPETNREVASIRIDATLGAYRRMLSWASRWPQRRWAIENAEGLGRHLASWLLARGEHVVDVSSTATARVRQLSRGGGRKNDRIDAAAAACVAALQGDARPLKAESSADGLALLDERRMNLAQARVRAVNQLHALLRDLIPGGAPTQLTADQAAALLRTVRPAGPAERIRKQLARDLVADARRRRPHHRRHHADGRGRPDHRQHTDHRGRHRSRAGRADPGPHPPPIAIRQRIPVRRLHRHRPHRGHQRRTGPSSPIPRR
jgi:hypothetical protein